MDNNLWPSFGDIKKVKTPKMILLEQASHLEVLTSNLLKAEVKQDYSPENHPFADEQEDNFSYKFVIIAPLLKKYSFTLLRIHYNINLYPVELTFVPKNITITEHDEESFKRRLKDIFNDDKTIEIIRNLLSQSMSEKDIPSNKW